MTAGTELRYISVSQYHYNTHAVVGNWMTTVCGKVLDDRHVERLRSRLTCKTCQELVETQDLRVRQESK